LAESRAELAHDIVNSSSSFDWRVRAKAALIHLTANACVAAAVAALVFVIWYPWPYHDLSGGTELFGLVVGCDVVLGPVITFVIFNRRKPRSELVRDLGIVVALQLVALGYGLHMTFVARPVALALEEDRFRVVAVNDVVESELPHAQEGMRSLSLTGPRLVYTSVPDEPAKRSEALSLALRGHDIGTRPSLWKPWDANARRAAVAKAKSVLQLMKRRPEYRTVIDAAVQRAARPAQTLVYIPMITFRGDWVALLDSSSGEVVGFAPVDGF
jgi:hypothetical protein